jgi:hypothetical protein
MTRDKMQLADAVAQDADEGWERPDDRFIPLRPADLAQRLTGEAFGFGMDGDDFLAVAHALEVALDTESAMVQRSVTNDYARFNPDRDTLAAEHESTAPTELEFDGLYAQIAYLLDKANYQRLSDVQIEQAVLRASRRSLHVRVHPDRVLFLEVWIRGRATSQKEERLKWRPWKHRKVTIDLFRRMVVVARLKDSTHVVLKLFKDIPEADVEALLPHAEVTMTLMDRAKLFATGAGTLGVTASKVLNLVLGLAALTKLLWILALGLGTICVRTILGYRRAHIDRDWQRTKHLYFQNLGNNASVLQLLVATVKQEELKETMLAYLFCHGSANQWRDSTQLCNAIEDWLSAKVEVRVDFDISDALEKLDRLDLFADRGELRTVSPAQAVSRLAKMNLDRASAKTNNRVAKSWHDAKAISG